MTLTAIKPTTALLLVTLTLGLMSVTYAQPLEAEPAQDNTSAQPKATSFAWENEEAYYKVKINGSEAIHAVMRVGELNRLKNSNKQPYVAIAASAQSVGLFKAVLEVEDRANTFIDPSSMLPLRAEKRFKERLFGGDLKERTYKVDYKPDHYQAKVNKKSNQHKTRNYIRHVPDDTHDGLSWFFALRNKPDFTLDEKISYYVYDGWKLSRLDLKVVKEEDVLTPVGWFKTWKLDVTREVLNSSAIFKDGKAIDPKLSVHTPAKELGSVWLSRDAQRVPVKIALTWKISQSSALTGQVDVMLVKYKRQQEVRGALRPVKQAP